MMKALVMCGGKGTRLGMGEKPLVKVRGKPLIDYVLDELWFCDEVYGVTTKYTPKTEEYLKNCGINIVRTSSKGYIEDFIEAIHILSLYEPILIVSADLVILKDDLILEIAEYYYSTDKLALTCVNDDGYVGINIIDGMFIDCYQEECIYRVKDVININSREDLRRAELWILMKKEKEW